MADRKPGKRTNNENNPRFWDCDDCGWAERTIHEATPDECPRCDYGSTFSPSERRVQDERRHLKHYIGERSNHNIIWTSKEGHANSLPQIEARMRDRRGPDRRKPLAKGDGDDGR